MEKIKIRRILTHIGWRWQVTCQGVYFAYFQKFGSAIEYAVEFVDAKRGDYIDLSRPM